MSGPFTGGPLGADGAPLPPPSLPPDVETASTSDAFMSPTRSLQHSEAQLMARCAAAVEQCRRDLGDLRAACKAAASYREKCTELLGAATEAVVALEDLLYDPGIDLRRERALQQLATRVQAALDQAEVVVRVYGGKNGLASVLSKMCSPGTPQKFDAAATELANLAKQVRLTQSQAPVPAGGRLLSGSIAMDSIQLPSSVGAQSSQPQVLGPAASSSMAGPSSPSPSSRSGAGQAAQLAPEASAAITAVTTATTAEQESPAPGGSGSQTAVVMWGDRFMPEEAMQQARVRKGGRGLAITAMVHVPPPADRPGHLGYLWYFLSKAFGTSSLFVWDLSAKVETEVREAHKGSTITCMHYDDQKGLIWTGHSKGEIRVWSAATQESLCPAHKGLSSAVTCITSDERGFCWAGSEKGRVRSFRLAAEQVDGLQVGYELILRGELLWTGDGMQAVPQSKVEYNEEGFAMHPLLQQAAHYGPVRSIAAAEQRVWTCGGSSAFARFKEWTQFGWPMSNADMRNTGLANDIVVVTQIVVVNEAQKVLGASLGSVATNSTALSSFTAAASLPLASRLPVAQTQVVEVYMPWQLLTAHDGGLVQVWGHVDGKLQPLLQIGERTAPALRAVVCEPLGALITAHNDGQLRLRALPHVRSPAGLSVTFKKDTVFKISSAALASAQIPMSKSGLASALGGRLGIVSASNSGAIKHLPVAELRRAAQDQGIAVLSELASADWSQWPLERLSAFRAHQLVEELAIAQQQYSTEYEDELHTERDGSEAQDRATLAISEDTEEWLIDWNDLHRSKIIGEGAFGKVWLGRWQETDVAIKQLGSLSALGVQTGSLQHDSSGGIKMDAEVQRALHKEVDLMRKMRHPNIILFMGVVAEPAAVVTEYCARGSLYDLLKEARNKPALTKALDWPRRVVMALDAAKGMLYLHGHKPQPIIHRDLKSPNLLVTKDWRVKVTDFNLSKSQPVEAVDKVASVQSLVANNPRWQPPEVIKEQMYTKASDVYAFGLILWELLTWELPFVELSNFQIMMAVTQQGKRPPLKDQWGAAQYPGGTFVAYDEYVALMQRCWAEDPEERPTFEQVINDLRKIAKIVADARAPARLLPAHSRTFSRSTPPHLAAPSPTPAPAAGPTPAPAAARTAAPSPFDAPTQQPGTAPAPPTPAVAGAAVAGAAAVAGGVAACNGHPQSLPGSAAGSTTAQPRSEAGTEAPLSTSQSGSTAPLAAGLSGASVVSGAPPPPSPFDPPPARPTVVASNAAMPAGPFGSTAPWLQQGAAAATGPAVSSAAPPPPSPFGGSPGGGGATPAAPAAAPPEDGPLSSAARAPPSPFGGATALPPAGAAVSSAQAPPPSPFGNALAVSPAGQPVSSAAPPPPSPFDAAPPAGQPVSSAAPPPPSPFDAEPPAGQPVSSAAQPSPSPFDGASTVVSSAAPPPPSPFGGAGAAFRSAAPPPSPFDAASAGPPVTTPPEAGRLSPFAAHLPADAPEPRQNWYTTGMPSTVLEASASAEAAAADGSGPQLETLQPGVWKGPDRHGSGSGPAPDVGAALPAGFEEAGNGVRSGSRRGLVSSLRKSFSGGSGRWHRRMQSQ